METSRVIIQLPRMGSFRTSSCLVVSQWLKTRGIISFSYNRSLFGKIDFETVSCRRFQTPIFSFPIWNVLQGDIVSFIEACLFTAGSFRSPCILCSCLYEKSTLVWRGVCHHQDHLILHSQVKMSQGDSSKWVRLNVRRWLTLMSQPDSLRWVSLTHLDESAWLT